MATLDERFWPKVDRMAGLGPWGDCHEWTGTRDRDGYGQVSVGGRAGSNRRAHVVAWILEHGEPPADKPCVLHRCDNPPCVRLDHLFTGTNADNIADRIRKGRPGSPGTSNPGERNGRSAKLTDDAVRDIRERAAAGEKQAVIAAEYDLRQSQVSRIVNRKRWGHLV